MSGQQRRREAPQDPPWSLDLLADLHAGVLDPQAADELRARIHDDQDAHHILAALEATRADLADLPPLSLPDDVATRIDAALQNEVPAWSGYQPGTGPDPVVDLDAARRRRRRRFSLVAGLGTAAAAVMGFMALGFGPHDSTSDVAQQATPPSRSAPLALQGEHVTLTPAQFSEALGSEQYTAPLSDPGRLVGCLRANGLTGGKPIGARMVTFNGKSGQLLVLSTGKIGQFRLLTVGPGCGPGNPDKISDGLFGG